MTPRASSMLNMRPIRLRTGRENGCELTGSAASCQQRCLFTVIFTHSDFHLWPFTWSWGPWHPALSTHSEVMCRLGLKAWARKNNGIDRGEKTTNSKSLCHNKSKEPIAHRVNEILFQNSVPLWLSYSYMQAPKIQSCAILTLIHWLQLLFN